MKIRERRLTGTTSETMSEREIRNRKAARRAAAEGFVLLRNRNGLLPVEKGSRIALYGAGAGRTIKGGTGSGDVNERDSISIYQGLLRAGYEITSEQWVLAYDRLYEEERCKWRDDILGRLSRDGGKFFDVYSTTPFQVPCGPGIDTEAAKQDGADTAVFVLSRIAGENADRRDEPGDYYITSKERALLDQISEAYDSVVLAVNTGGLIDLGFADELPNIDAIVQFVQAGQEGGSAFADILSGDVTPSGKLADTWALQYGDYPNAQTFSHKNGDVETEKYEEGIYVGYRYFDTFDVPVRYGFGYGLSYTEFDIHTLSIKKSLPEGMGEGEISAERSLPEGVPGIEIEVSVENIGNRYAGKETVQVYVSCPQKKMAKEFRRLAAFAKTKLLAPGESEELKLSFSLYQLASYSEEDAAWMLEQGTYGVWMGNSLESSGLIGTFCLDEDAVMVRCGHICPLKEELKEIAPDPGNVRKKESEWMEKAKSLAIRPLMFCAGDIASEEIEYTEMPEVLPGPAGEIVNSLSLDQMVQLAAGDPGKGQESALGSAGISVPGSAAETSSAAGEAPWNVASMVLADGPAGLRLNQSYQVVNGSIVKDSFMKSLEKGFFMPETKRAGTTYYQYCTAIPVGTLLAQTWNTALMKEVGEMIGREMEEFGVTLWLAPGMNIHRNPLCGRNFEYYSEDPLLSGAMAAAVTLGVQKLPGIGTTIKHFACNNQEDNRKGSNSVVSERALREIYLRGFEIAVKTSQPMAIMTSYNLINGVHSANSRDLCTVVAREEWGFRGIIMTDWTTTGRGGSSAWGCVAAGNDLIMPGSDGDHEEIRAALADGQLDAEDLRRCVERMLTVIFQTNAFENGGQK